MAFTVQDDTGAVADANSYIDVATFDAYHADRGNDLTAFDTTMKEQALVVGTDYLDTRWRHKNDAPKSGDTQTTVYPREIDEVIPEAVKEALSEYGLVQLNTPPLWPLPAQSTTGAAVQKTFEKVDVIEESVEYVDGASFRNPKYPAGDNKLISAGLVCAGGSSARF